MKHQLLKPTAIFLAIIIAFSLASCGIGSLSSSNAASESRQPLADLPVMTAENKAYCDKYVFYGLYTPFDQDFTEESYLTDFHVYMLFRVAASLQGLSDEYDQNNSLGWFPADFVENTLKGCFLFSADDIRNAVGTDPNNSYNQEYYDASKNAYYFQGGYGGASLMPVVTASKQDGDLLTLSVDWYNWRGVGPDGTVTPDGTGELMYVFTYSNDLTIRLEDGGGFKYIANKVTANDYGESPATMYDSGWYQWSRNR